MSEALDRHITGNYGEDQFSGMNTESAEEQLSDICIFHHWTYSLYSDSSDDPEIATVFDTFGSIIWIDEIGNILKKF